eukprot:GSMAST32.ASY1.ANO1.1330.1 assembled CDS
MKAKSSNDPLNPAIFLEKSRKAFQTALSLDPSNKKAKRNIAKLITLDHPIQKFQMKIPRVTMQQLAQNITLLTGTYPYIITDAMKSWTAIDLWKDEDYLVNIIGDEWVDFYAKNMKLVGAKPILYRYTDAHKRFKIDMRDDKGHPRYLQFRLSNSGWKKLKRDFGTSTSSSGRFLPDVMWTEDDWLYQCVPDPEDVDNFLRVNQWNMLLIGEIGTGMFLHHDHLAAASWQAHIIGRKEWIICPYNQSHLIGNTKKGGEHIMPFDNVDYTTFPNFSQAFCGREILSPGEILYYPAYWWHATQCLDRPTIGITGLLVGNEDERSDIGGTTSVHERFASDILAKCQNCWDDDCHDINCRKCPDISEKWPGAAPPISKNVCNNIKDCLVLWEEHYNTRNATENNKNEL